MYDIRVLSQFTNNTVSSIQPLTDQTDVQQTVSMQSAPSTSLVLVFSVTAFVMAPTSNPVLCLPWLPWLQMPSSQTCLTISKVNNWIVSDCFRHSRPFNDVEKVAGLVFKYIPLHIYGTINDTAVHRYVTTAYIGHCRIQRACFCRH